RPARQRVRDAQPRQRDQPARVEPAEEPVPVRRLMADHGDELRLLQVRAQLRHQRIGLRDLQLGLQWTDVHHPPPTKVTISTSSPSLSGWSYLSDRISRRFNSIATFSGTR